MSTVFAACGGSDKTEASMTENTESAATDTLDFGPLKKLSLNDATGEQFAMIPGVGRRMVREFLEYRPYISIDQFRREMGKYVDADTVAAYEKYLYVPVSFNESDLATLMQIPGMTTEFAQALIDGRPYETKDAFLDNIITVANDGVMQQFARYYLAQETASQE
jgi:DNA uptake protein ComE-like DNA-binding protein